MQFTLDIVQMHRLVFNVLDVYGTIHVRHPDAQAVAG